MLNNESFENYTGEDVAAYAADRDAAAVKQTKNQLCRMYPTSNIDRYSPEVLQNIMTRTLHHMLYFDEKFDMNSTFDDVYFQKMHAEAIILGDWLDSEDGTPYPSALRHVYPDIGEQDESKSLEPSESNDSPVKKITPRSVSAGSKFQRAKLIYNEDITNGCDRNHTLDRCVTELGMDRKTANVYYSKFKHPVTLTETE